MIDEGADLLAVADGVKLLALAIEDVTGVAREVEGLATEEQASIELLSMFALYLDKKVDLALLGKKLKQMADERQQLEHPNASQKRPGVIIRGGTQPKNPPPPPTTTPGLPSRPPGTRAPEV